MATAGNITAVLTLNSSGFQTGLDNAINSLTNFKTNANSLNSTISNLSKVLQTLENELVLNADSLTNINNMLANNKNFVSFANAVNNIAKALKTLSSDAVNVETGMNVINNILKQLQSVAGNSTIKVQGLARALKELNASESSSVSSTTNLKNAFNSSYMSADKFGQSLRNARLEEERQKQNLEMLTREFNRLALGINEYNTAQNTATRSTQQYDNALSVTLPKQREMIINATGVANANRQLSSSSNQVSSAENKQSLATDKATNSLKRQETASKSLGKAMSSLRMMGTMVGSMIAYNFVHNLAMATTETINAKSEMNGYFQMLGYTTSQTERFNRALEKTVQKFPRLNKYALGETISSIGVEFELTTKEMEKAMPVVSMITSEYLRAGRNVNEASLAVKDILQGEFQRLSRETGVKGDQLKEAGWSGDKSDVMGLLEALEKVGKERNWDTFVQKANSLNDAVLITQNRFSEWSADMVERVQPAIVGAFNSIMSVAELFASGINSVADWLSGDGIGQGIVKWGGLATALGLVVTALIHYRTGATLTQIAQMGLTKSIGASILGLEAETVAQYGLRNAIVSTVTGIEAETLANEENVISRQARLQAITSTITGYELETVASKGVLKSLIASSFGAKESTLTQYGLSTAIAEATTQMEAQKLASMSLAQRIALIGATTIPAMAVITAFAVAFGKLVLETKQATDNMAKFYDIQQHGTEHIQEAKDSVKNLKSHIKDLKKTQEDYTKGSEEYKNVGKAIDDLNSKMDIAKQNVKDNYEALQLVNSAQKNYDTTKQEAQLDLQQKINQSLVDTGLSVEEANQLSNNYLNDAIDGSHQLYEALQSVVNQYDKEAQGVASLTDYWTQKGLSPDEIKVKLDPYIDSQNAIVKDIETIKASSDMIEVASTWLKLQVDQIQLTLNENLPKIEAGDWQGGLTGILKGVAHGVADLPVFGDFWNWVFDYSGARDKYAGKGWDGLSQWIDDSIWQIENFIITSLTDDKLNLDSLKQHTMEMVGKLLEDPLGTLGIQLPEFDPNKLFGGDSNGNYSRMKKIDINGLLSSIFDFANGFDIGKWFDENIAVHFKDFDLIGAISSLIGTHASDSLSASMDISVNPLTSWFNNTIIIPLTNFASDPIGTLSSWGLTLPQLDLGGLIQGLFNIGGEGGFDIGGWLASIFNIDTIVSTFTTNLGIIFTTASTIANNVSNVFNNLKNMIWGHIQGILSNVTSTFTNIKNTAVNQINGLSSGIKGGIDKVVNAFNYMKDCILNSAKAIYDGVKAKFDSVKNTIGDFWNKLTNPSSWGSAGSESYQRRSPKPQTARRLFAGSPVVRSAIHHGAGVNPYTNDSQSVKLKDLMGMIDGDNKVKLSDFLAMFSEGGFGTWDFHEPVKKKVFDTAKNYKTGSPSIKGIGTVGDGYKVEKFWDGKPKFAFEEFQAVAQAIFSAIPYKFYYDSEWKGSWLNALLSGAVNCSDGADALIALARVFGFDGYKQHTTLKSGVGHFFAVIGGKKMDTTNFQNHGSWSPLGGAGIPTRTASHIGRAGETQGKTVNITVSMDNAVIYGVDDLDSRIQDSVQKGIQSEFNDPYTIAI